VCGAVPKGCLEFQNHPSARIDAQALGADGGTSDVAGDAFELVALVGITRHGGVERKAVTIDGERFRR